jgi:hypothetical protein
VSRSVFIKFIALGSLPLCLIAVLLAGGFYVISVRPDPNVSAARSSPATFTDRAVSNVQLTEPMPSLTNQEAVDYLKQSGMDRSLYDAVSAARHNVEHDRGRLIASNHANDLKAEFNNAGLQLESASTNENWQSAWQLRSIGYGDHQVMVPHGEITSNGQRVEISRKESNLVEWYENRPNGLEHGFTLARRVNSEQDASQALRLVIDVRGGLRVKAESSGQGLILTDEKNNEILRYKNLKVWDADNREQIARMMVSDDQVLLEVEEENARYPLTIDPTFVEAAKLVPSDGAEFDLFGQSIAISGDTVVVGANADDDNGTNSGSAYVFVRSGGNWTLQQKLVPAGVETEDRFGGWVDIDGDTIVAASSLDDDLGNNAGAAYVFVRNGTVWSQQQKLVASDGADGDQFSQQAVAISGDTIICGNGGDDDNGIVAGSAYVFVRNGSVWTEQQKLLPSDAATQDLFGTTADIDGNTIIVGAYGNDDNGSSSGSAYIFVRNGTVWTEQQKLLASDGTAGDFFGHNVAISGDSVVVGAYIDDANGAESGSAYVFVRNGTIWSQQQKLLPSDPGTGDRFGQAIAISGDTVVIGAYLNNDLGNDSGSAYVFARSGAVWSEQQKLLPSDGTENDAFGVRLTVEGDTIAVASFGDDDNGQASGSAYVFEIPTPNQAPVAQCKNVQVTLASGPAVTAIADINDGSFDPDGDSITLSQSPAGPYPVGSTLVTLTVEDSSGETDSCTGTVTVLYNFTGFFQPIENNGTVNVVKAGASVPVKFSLDGDKGLGIFMPGSPSSWQTTCDYSGNTSPIEETVTAGASTLTYNPVTDQYEYVWKTEKSWKGQCRQLVVTLKDGTTHTANFQVK